MPIPMLASRRPAHRARVAMACSAVTRGMRPPSTSRTCSGVRLACSTPASATETMAVSSETTMTIASVSSLSPRAARWRVPRDRSPLLACESGRMQPAPMMVSPRTITAPSCSGEYGVKMVASRSAVRRACMSDPLSMNAVNGTSRSMAMMAPIPERDRRSTAFAISSSNGPSSGLRKKRVTCDCPRWASAARSSGWKTTSRANAPYVNTKPSR